MGLRRIHVITSMESKTKMIHIKGDYVVVKIHPREGLIQVFLKEDAEEVPEEEVVEEGKVSRGVTIQIWFLFRTTNWLHALQLGRLIVNSAIVDV